MLSVSRRIVLYWLLLLVPALVVGGVAIQLLRREEARLRQQGAAVEEARRVALETQVRLIVENVELFAGDVQSGLLDTLATEPAERLEGFMQQWEATNPLVRIAYRCRWDGRLLRPDAGSPGLEAQGFLRRFGAEFSERPPWQSARAAEKSEVGFSKAGRTEEESWPRRTAVQNVQQTQSARRDLQQLALARDYAPASSAVVPRTSAPSAATPARAKTAEGKVTAEIGAATTSADAVSQKDAAAPLVPPERGWHSRVIDGRLHVLGWVRSADGEVRGVELQMAALVSRLGGALPAEVAAGDGFALRDAQGRVVHQRGELPTGKGPRIAVPLAVAVLPGWEVVAYLSGVTAEAGGRGLFWVGALLVGIFVAAIVAGGSLLLWQARQSEAEATQKTSFVANVSHEFKTPLTTIRLYAELLEQGRVRDAAQGGEYLRTIANETQRLARLVNNALDFSRLEQGRKQYRRERLDLASEISRLLDTHAPRVAEAGLVLQRNLPPSPCPVNCDRDALEQIVLNLIDNACKYAAAGGEVTVSAGPAPRGGVEVRVGDRGPGVPAAQRERIFEKFHRVDDALTAEKSGAGLGLSIARQLARGLGGELRCAARDGGGAEFILHLP